MPAAVRVAVSRSTELINKYTKSCARLTFQEQLSPPGTVASIKPDPAPPDVDKEPPTPQKRGTLSAVAPQDSWSSENT